ncbi:hypothetical protein ACTL6U_10655 [Rhodovibrionaceae bacterium A322]
MLLVRQVDGPEEIAVGAQAHYRASQFNQSNPSAAQLAEINWQINLEGQEISRQLGVGPSLTLSVEDSWQGKNLTVMPFANSPTKAVSVTTRILDRPPVTPPVALSPPGPQEAYQVVTRYDASLSRCYARCNDGPEYYVGSKVSYDTRVGLSNIYVDTGATYDPDKAYTSWGHWAYLLYPTALCESGGYYNRLNTYDRASFTFGFLQWAAHTANANFVLLLRQLLTLPEAKDYFPDLSLKDGHVQQWVDDGWLDLEAGGSDLPRLRAYLNPSATELSPRSQEVSARFVDWCNRFESARDQQDLFAFRSYQKNLRDYGQRYDLDGRLDQICLLVADIRHQGRASSSTILAALEQTDALAALLDIGKDSYPERIATLRRAMDGLVSQGKLGRLVYDKASNSFVSPRA